MKSLWIILLTGLFVIAICSLILYSPVRVRAEYRHQEDDDAGQIELSFLWNLIRWRKKLIGVEVEPTKNGPAVTVHQRPAADATGSGHPPKAPGAATKARTDRLSVAAVLRNVPHWLAIMREARPKIQQLARRSHLDRLHIAAQLGTGDAVHTGILCGGLAATLYACAGWLTHQMGRSETPNIAVTPSFQTPVWSIEGTCILNVRLGYAIVAAFHLTRLWRRRTPHGASHSRVNAYGDV